MFVKIKDLPEKIKEKACKRMYQERKFVDENYLLSSAFQWSETKEGDVYWSYVCRLFGKESVKDVVFENSMVGSMEVIEPKEVKPDPIVESVVNQLRDRSEVGIKKYGTTLDDNNLSTKEWIEHAKQEAMDFVLYLEKLKTTL
jgi:hypothetical protein